MSLINDALKRVKRVQAPTAAAPVAEALLQPAEAPRAGARSTLGLLIAVLVAALVMAGWFYHQWKLASERVADQTVRVKLPTAEERALTQPAVTEPRSIVKPVPPPVPVPPAPTQPGADTAPWTPGPEPVATVAAAAESTSPTPIPISPVPSIPATDQPAPGPPEDKPAPPPAPAPPAFPTLKLQGIFYSRTKPSALINGQTLYVGDEIEGARVKAIEARKVVVEFGDETRTLSLR